MTCELCGRPRATQDDFDTIPLSEGAHLCWFDWDPEQCYLEWFERDPDKLYAVDLRRAGLGIPESIPGCAHVPRGSLRYGKPDLSMSASPENIEQRRIVGTFPVEFTEPFEWVVLNVQLPTKEKP